MFGFASDLTPFSPDVQRICTNLMCVAPATAQVMVGAQWEDKCFTHEREYADRFGAADIRPIPPISL